MKKIYLLSLFLFIMLASQAQYSWVNKNPLTAGARCAATAFSSNNLGYLVGGFTQYPGVWVNEVWAYSPSTDSWTQKNSFPYANAGAASLSFGDSTFVIGGYIGSGNLSNSNHVYNTASDSWTPKASFPATGISGPFQFVINGIGYLGAGERQGANTSTTVYSYNPTFDSWNQVANYPESVEGLVGFAIDSLGYAGLGGDGSNHLSSGFYKYSPTANTWTAIAAFPGELRNSALAFVLNGKAYVGGGWTTIPNNISVIYDLGDFYEYDPASDTWAPVPGFPGRARQDFSAFTVNGGAYVIGGYNDNLGGTVSTVNEFGTCSILTGILPISGGNNKAGIEIYPNPSTNDVNVKILTDVTSEMKYEVVSVDGKLIKKGTTRQSNFGFNANNFADGVYILTITDGNGTQGAERFEVMH